MGRKIIHIDMDAFYASVEQRDRPHLKGVPVIVGGPPHARGVVATCSYEARKYGVHSAMPSRRAFQLCPRAVFIRPRFDVYRAVSAQIMELFLEVTPLVEPLSLDEAYLDVTENNLNMTSATHIAEYILAEIKRRTDLTASAGVSNSKLVAKIASGYQKPNGLTVLPPEEVLPFLSSLQIGDLHGVGKVTEQTLRKHGFETVADIQQSPVEELRGLLGRDRGTELYTMAHGEDERLVRPHRERKSIGSETTFEEDTEDIDTIFETLKREAQSVVRSLQQKELVCRTVTVKWKTETFQSRSKRFTFLEETNDEDRLLTVTTKLFNEIEFTGPIRLIGMSVSHLEVPPKSRQLTWQDIDSYL
ncbi:MULTISPECIES: DNA polymerase IV [unclassified Exiguobacterium]|uniref:DNA polymerase IV n=1 Tax=unclassified Exiguobacterium TaxID=2644629 RepID=UPI0020366722|nr:MULTISPECIES: DNA polymerase IV [unclassified Exiguobacterium]